MNIVWDIDTAWILSQIFVVVGYGFFLAMYIPKSRNRVLVLGILGSLFFSINFIFIREWTGFYSGGLMLFRNVAFLGWALLMKGKKQTRLFDTLILGIVFVCVVLITIFTFDAWYDIFPAFAVMIFSVGLWQKNTKTFRILGATSGAFWLVYMLLVGSAFGLILESIILGMAISSVVFYDIIERLNNNKTQEKS